MNVERERWKSEYVSQTRTTPCKTIATKYFDSEQEALEFYRRNKRGPQWPWKFWSYPVKVVPTTPDWCKGCPNLKDGYWCSYFSDPSINHPNCAYGVKA